MAQIYIPLDNKKLDFTMEEVEAFELMWNDGISIIKICNQLKRTKIEIAVLIMDRADKGYIKSRPGGLFGRE